VGLSLWLAAILHLPSGARRSGEHEPARAEAGIDVHSGRARSVIVALRAGSSDHHDIGVTLRDLLPEPLISRMTSARLLEAVPRPARQG